MLATSPALEASLRSSSAASSPRSAHALRTLERTRASSPQAHTRFEPSTRGTPRDHPSQTGYAEALRAYSESIEPFNGWLARHTFTLTARATPDWGAFSQKIGPKESILEDVSLWSTAVSAVLQRMEQMHLDRDLEDMRKSI